MMHGRVVRPPTITSKPTSIDESTVKNIPGLIKVVQEGSFVGVVCETEWAAIKAARALKVSWSQPPTKMPADAEEVFAYIKNTKSLRDQVTVNKGNPDTALGQASKTYEATSRWPSQLHGMMGPSSAVADVGKDRATLSTGHKVLLTAQGCCRAPGFLKSNACSTESRQGYGRRPMMFRKMPPASAVGKPVRVNGCAMMNMAGSRRVRRS
jgi:hypothetical protein